MVGAQKVGDIVTNLFDEFGIPSAIVEALRDDRDISGKLREAAIRNVNLASRNPELLVARAWETLMREDSSEEAYSNALLLSEMALDLDPLDLEYRGAVAAAHYRNGNYEEAHELLAALEALDWGEAGKTPSAGPIFLAMTEFQLGHSELALAILEGRSAHVARPSFEPATRELYGEAEALIRAGD